MCPEQCAPTLHILQLHDDIILQLHDDIKCHSHMLHVPHHHHGLQPWRMFRCNGFQCVLTHIQPSICLLECSPSHFMLRTLPMLLFV